MGGSGRMGGRLASSYREDDLRRAADWRSRQKITAAAVKSAAGRSMTVRRHLITAVAAIALALAVAAPVAADNASYPGCSNFGAVQTGDVAPHGVLGAMISSLAPSSDLLGPGTRISDIVAFEHGVFCAHP